MSCSTISWYVLYTPLKIKRKLIQLGLGSGAYPDWICRRCYRNSYQLYLERKLRIPEHTSGTTSLRLQFVLLLIYSVYYGPKEAMHPIQMKHLFSKLGTVTSLGLAGTIMVSLLPRFSLIREPADPDRSRPSGGHGKLALSLRPS